MSRPVDTQRQQPLPTITLVLQVLLLGGSSLLLGCGTARATPNGPSSAGGPAPRASTPPATSIPPSTTTTQPSPTARSLNLTFVDPSRPTVSHGHQLAASRTLPTTVWLPAGAMQHPLIVFAHGYRLGVAPYRRLCQRWADAGFVVAAPSFPLTDQSAAGVALDESDIANQPDDLKFLITQLLQLTNTPNSPLSGEIDSTKIAVGGHSDGAETALAAAYLPAKRDPRIRAVIADAANPFVGVSANKQIVSAVPLLLVQGDADKVVPFGRLQRLARQVQAPGWLLRLHGADHLSPIKGPSRWTSTLDSVTRDFLYGVFAGVSSADRLRADSSADPGASTLTALI